jgi:hypothetical protein
MKRSIHIFVVILFSLFMSCLSFAQTPEESIFQGTSLKTGLGFEFFNRSMDTFTLNSDNDSWDKDEDGFNLKSYFFTFTAEFEIQEGLSVAAIVGYAYSNLDSIIFRKLPFSVEMEVGQIGGLLFGGEIRKTLFYIRDFETEAFGQFIYYTGSQKEWEIPGLSEEGTVEGTPSWMRASIGPVFIYRAFDYFFPYFSLNYNRIWGKYKMDQTVQDLKGSEDKKISGKGSISINLGAIYELTDALSIKGEASFIPYKGGVDLGIQFKAMYIF